MLRESVVASCSCRRELESYHGGEAAGGGVVGSECGPSLSISTEEFRDFFAAVRMHTQP